MEILEDKTKHTELKKKIKSEGKLEIKHNA